MIALLTGFFKPYLAYIVIAGLGLGALLYVKHVYDASIISGIAAKQSALILADERKQNAVTVAALEQRAVTAEANATYYASIKGSISNAKPSTFSCVRSDAGRAALGGLRANRSH